MRLLTLAATALLACAGLSALLAQSIDGLDLQEVKRRAADLQADAQAFVAQVKDRGDAFRDEALVSRQSGMANLQRIATTDLPKGNDGAVDFDEIVQGAASNANVAHGDAPQFIVFASLSMPPASLKALIADTARAGGVVVFRGFPDNSAKAFMARLAPVLAASDMPNIGIDPRLFRAFDVQAVPTYVTVSSDFDLCAGFACQDKVPPHDRLTGNVTVEYALDTMVAANGPGARIAALALANLRRGQQR